MCDIGLHAATLRSRGSKRTYSLVDLTGRLMYVPGGFSDGFTPLGFSLDPTFCLTADRAYREEAFGHPRNQASNQAGGSRVPIQERYPPQPFGRSNPNRRNNKELTRFIPEDYLPHSR